MNDYFDEIRRFQREMNRFFDNFLPMHTFLPVENKDSLVMREPLTDLKETDKEFIASFEIPGVDKKDIELNITDNNLEIKVEKKDEARVEKKGYIRSERFYKGFYRSIGLPCKVKADEAKASYKNGVLEVIIPKAEKTKSTKIEIE